MNQVIQIVGPNGTVQLFGVKLLGVNAENGKKLLFSIIFIGGVYLLGKVLRKLTDASNESKKGKRAAFWTRQGISIALAVITVVGLLSLWFNDPKTLATGIGLVTAGLAFALQRVVTSFAGYLLILRGKSFSVGDRITMGGIRGDVVALNFLQTVIMEMGEPGDSGSSDSTWVHARQYTGRLVRISNAEVFDKPIYNYTREFPYIWEEMTLPVPYNADRQRAEQILLETARKHTIEIAKVSEEDLREMERRYAMRRADIKPEVFWKLTDNWISMTVRFIVTIDGIRKIKTDMSREIIAALDAAKISVASGTYEVVGMPPIHVVMSEAGAKAASNGS